MEFLSGKIDFAPEKGKGPLEGHQTYGFQGPVAWATAVMTGYNAYFRDGDHELGELTVQLGTRIVNGTEGPEVVVHGRLGLRDYSGTWDDAYGGTIHFFLIVELERRRPLVHEPII